MSLVEELAPGLSGLEQLRALRRLGRKPGIAESLKFRIVEIEEGLAVFEGAPDAHAYNPIGTVQGATPPPSSTPPAAAPSTAGSRRGKATRRSS